MNCCNKNEGGKDYDGKNNLPMGVKDLFKMAACCGGPLAGAAILEAFGINASFLAVLACPLMMGYMLWMMGKMQPSKDRSSGVEESLGVKTGLKPASTNKSTEQPSQKSSKELPSDLPKVWEIARKDLSGEVAYRLNEGKVNEEKV
jgi:hypothetical protein